MNESIYINFYSYKSISLLIAKSPAAKTVVLEFEY